MGPKNCTRNPDEEMQKNVSSYWSLQWNSRRKNGKRKRQTWTLKVKTVVKYWTVNYPKCCAHPTSNSRDFTVFHSVFENARFGFSVLPLANEVSEIITMVFGDFSWANQKLSCSLVRFCIVQCYQISQSPKIQWPTFIVSTTAVSHETNTRERANERASSRTLCLCCIFLMCNNNFKIICKIFSRSYSNSMYDSDIRFGESHDWFCVCVCAKRDEPTRQQ